MRPRGVLRWSVWSVVALLLALSALAWWLASEHAVRWAARWAEQASAGRLAIENPHRLGWIGVGADRLHFRDQGIELEATRFGVTVSIRSLWRRAPVFRQLVADDVEVRLRPSDDDTPVSLPQTLSLGIDAEIRALRLGRLSVIRGDTRLDLRQIELGLVHDQSHYRLQLGSLRSDWARLSGNLVLAHAVPFTLDGLFRVEPAQPQTAPLTVALTGQLEAIGVGISGVAFGADLGAQVALAPFARDTVVDLAARVDGFDPKALAPQAPAATVEMRVEARVTAAGRVSGRVNARNLRPGLLAQSRLPVVRAGVEFAGEGERWRFSELAVDAQRAGRLTGGGRFEGGRLQLDLRAFGLDLEALHAGLYPTALAGNLHIETDGAAASVRGTLEQPGVRLAFDAASEGETVTVRSAQLTGSAGSVDLRGRGAFAAPHGFELNGRVRGFDPSKLGDFPTAALNGGFTAAGQAVPLDARVRVVLDDSRFRGQALAANAEVVLAPERLARVDATVRLGAARLDANGAFGAAGDRLSWRLDVPDLARVWGGGAGSVRASGVLSDTWRQPAAEFRADVERLRWGQTVSVRAVEVKGELAPGIDGRFDVRARAEAARASDTAIDAAALEIAGTRARHEAVAFTTLGAHRLSARIVGALNEGPAWSGQIASFEVEGPLPARLEQAANVRWSPSEGRAGPAAFRFGSGRIRLDELSWSRGQLASRGAIDDLLLASLQALVAVPGPVRDLVLAGTWDISAGDSLDGRVELSHRAGDVMLPATPAIPLGLKALRLTLLAQGGALSADLAIESTAVGRAAATGSTRASRRGTTWGVAGDAPVALKASATMPSLNWLRPVLGDDVLVGGAAELDLSVRGTVAEPLFDGGLRGSGIQIAIPDQGILLHDGRLSARFEPRALEITEFNLSGADGRLSGNGRASLTSGRIEAKLELLAQRLTVIARPDRLVTLSGATTLAWSGERLSAAGRLVVDRGRIELAPQDKPTPSRDVIVVGRKPAGDPDVGIHADLQFDLGDDFTIRGRGLDARLAGDVRLRMEPKSSPALIGTVRVAQGTYTAFGQRLAIERGAIGFTGPIDNPALDILAVRKSLAVEAGVAVGGTVLVPRVRLVSTPVVSDAEKLAWLTLGHGLSSAGRNDAAILQAAAQALLAQGDPTGGSPGLARQLGLDDLSLVASSDTGEHIVTIGKRLGSNVYVGFERGITGAVSVVKITYDLSRRWSVQGRAGTENAVDLFYTLGFR